MKQIRVRETPTHWIVKSPATQEMEIPRDGRWTFNGDFENPTFSPSLNETCGFAGETHEQMAQGRISQRNHCFIRDGFIEYLSDCTHAMAGQTVKIPPLSELEVGYYGLD